MNFVQLAREVKRETGLSGGGPASVATAAGDDLRIFNWVNWAARDITLQREDWGWRRGSATVASTLLQANTAAAFGVTDLATWKRENPTYKPSVRRLSEPGEGPLRWLDYDSFRALFIVGTHTPGQPQYWSTSPAGDFLIGPTPDSACFLRADYIKDYTSLTADTDIPAIPARFHSLIVWRALMEYGGFDAAQEVYMRAEKNYDMAWPQLSQSELATPRFRARGLS